MIDSKIEIRHGCMYLGNSQPISLLDATVSRAVDPLDGSQRIALCYKVGPDRETVYIEPTSASIDHILGSIQRQVAAAKTKWANRSVFML